MFFLWLGLWLLHVWVFWRLISFDSCGQLPWGQPLFLFLRRLPFFFSPVQPCRPFVRAECIHSRLQMLTMRNMTYIYFLGETILRIRNNCRENCSQFWWVGGEGRQHTLKRDCCDPWPPQQRPQGGGGGGEEDDMNEKQTGFSIWAKDGTE